MEELKQIVAMQRDEDLQSLYRRAAQASVSPAMIMRLWYGQDKLSRQPKEIIDFLFRALVVDDESECEEEPEAVDVDLINGVKAGDPWMLRELIERNAGGDEAQAVSVLAVLAWMGFDEDEVLHIRPEEIDLLWRTVCGRKIPNELYSVITEYYFDEEHMAGPCIGRGQYSLRVVSDRNFVRIGPDMEPERMLMAQYGVSYQELKVAGEHYRSRPCEGKGHQIPI